ncbi:Putative glycosyltransferase EpsH [Marinomonas aquimarina]|uniref:Putative glycosyltransferase EpsH n=1 Tax=Marinomonas aquimarina TaxID=295068 RepID=A0A1A8T1M5_9GAMM|nr:glycosyltransferase family 2 protein [Marinomonas aquimarina]SBS25858.1 Putative glycosyltransferase EpsH [Marinomonas aquimarina]
MSEVNAAVSVVIRTKNRPELLQQAVLSVLAQSYRPLELVVVNDGGADIAPQLQDWLYNAADISLNLIQHEQSVGRTNAANVGLNAANSPFCVFLDDDDYFDPEHISSLVAVHHHVAAKGALVAVHCQARAVHIDKNGEEHLLSVTGHALAKNQLFYQNSLPILTVLLPTAVRELGVAFDSKFDLFEDWDFWLQVSEHCELHFLEKASCAYRIHDAGSGVRDNSRQHLAFQQVYEKWLPKLSDSEQLSLLADTHQWRESAIASLQALNQAEFDRIGSLHTYALQVIASKDKDIEHLSQLLSSLQRRYKYAERIRNAFIFMINKLLRSKP